MSFCLKELSTTISALILQCFLAIRTRNTTRFTACTFQPSRNLNDVFDGSVIISFLAFSVKLDV